METLTEKLGKSKMFALPEVVAQKHAKALRFAGITFRETRVHYEPYRLRVALFAAEDANSAHELAERVAFVTGADIFRRFVIARYGARRVPYFCGFNVKVTEMPLPVGDAERELTPSERRTILEVVGNLGRLAGKNIDLYPEDRLTSRPPLPECDDLIRIYPWSPPPGECGDEFVYTLFNIAPHVDGDGVLGHIGVSGRGTILKDGEKPFAQVIGNNWYILIPVFQFYNKHTTARLLGCMLARILESVQNSRASDANGRRSRPQRSGRKEFLAKTKRWATFAPSQLRESNRKDREKIAYLEREILSMRRALADSERLLADIEGGDALGRLLCSFPRQWQNIRRNPYIASISIEDDGINATTVPVIIEDEGVAYALGTFTIRVGQSCRLHVWANDSRHPEGFPHPHINNDGSMCFGNASSAIKDALVERRYDDVIAFTARWLVEGYDRKLALRKITEWQGAAIQGTAPAKAASA